MNAAVDLTNVVLETKRLILRPWKETDLGDFYEYAKVDGVGQMAGWEPHKSLQESKMILDMFIREKKTFALELKENHKVIGSVGLENLSLLLDEKYENRTGREIGYVLSKDYWGEGLMPEAVKRVIEKSGFRFVKEAVRKTLNGEERTSKYYVLENPKRNPIFTAK